MEKSKQIVIFVRVVTNDMYEPFGWLASNRYYFLDSGCRMHDIRKVFEKQGFPNLKASVYIHDYKLDWLDDEDKKSLQILTPRNIHSVIEHQIQEFNNTVKEYPERRRAWQEKNTRIKLEDFASWEEEVEKIKAQEIESKKGDADKLNLSLPSWIKYPILGGPIFISHEALWEERYRDSSSRTRECDFCR